MQGLPASRVNRQDAKVAKRIGKNDSLDAFLEQRNVEVNEQAEGQLRSFEI